MEKVLIALESDAQPEWFTFHLSAAVADGTIELSGSDIIDVWRELGAGGIANKVFSIRIAGETYERCKFIGRAAQFGDAEPMVPQATFAFGDED